MMQNVLQKSPVEEMAVLLLQSVQEGEVSPGCEGEGLLPVAT
jgi:hypothetical protein